ncbi:MAG: phenylalanine 4-monooxygenase [Myxococcota bacterium]
MEARPGAHNDIVSLNPDHPGFNDTVYRARRNEIARIARDYTTGQPVPLAPYTPREHAVWSHVWSELLALYPTRVCEDILALQDVVPLSTERIPQLREINRPLEAASGFRMEPVAGLVSSRMFMRFLGRRVFLSTQYIRHHSRPLYTPEPDVIHELAGHVATLAHPGIAALNLALGQAAEIATDAEMRRLGNVYWYALEFGVVEERGQLRAAGAGLLSSYGELSDFDAHSRLLDWDLDAMGETDYDPTGYQEVLFVAPSFKQMLTDVTEWVERRRWRR